VGNEHEGYLLYIRAECSLCLGGTRKGIFMNCPYCDADRKTFIEASFGVIRESLGKTLTETQKKELIKYLKSDGE